MAGGRPTKLNDEMMGRAESYLDEYETAIPTVAGLSVYLGVSRSTVNKWSVEIDRFSDITCRIMAEQEIKLVDKGLIGEFNPAITKLMLTKHGFTDRQEVDAKVTTQTHEEWLESLS